MGRKLKGKIGSKNLKSSLLRHQHKEQLLKKNKNKIENKQKPKIPTKVKQNQQLQKENEEKYIPFGKEETLLLIGEGDFSYARSIIEQEYILPKNLIVTSYDASIQELKLKYPHSFEENYKFLIENGVLIFFRIDATNLIKSFKISKKMPWKKIMMNYGHPELSNKVVQNIMFNFPHTGKGVKDMDRNIRDHQELIYKYFSNCKDLFSNINSTIINSRNSYTQGYSLDSNGSNGSGYDKLTEEGFGKIILSVFTGEPYDLWQVRTLAKDNGLKVERSNKFQWENYPEYHHRRTNSEQDTTKRAEEREARIYVFEKFVKNKNLRKSKKGKDSDSDDE
ncbi:hypothetical protein Kpol_1003p31 [Vanderwaltozyma polyspora DSM 70294]|uniref:25S rRNA (uridine-N(3))-methyltransferase BMT5-like domain-containing protein n=1 Tax=Vanderwaltozyma polyspora (strain ATCC 22028 / DSM 70294 / BCRC 21397 / CBS 2163 / NBRC 10782 / NRRL Y-8283 / UCD 57-17) TaxID=436907 RepID=A7TLY9_VANPO|nr:uncharacterized protein Kpol_1003p31 [Vanderwaltozyma polyspora DSM 70294]EDO16726.1 hypothetical protein Kpol_1003p31 [Vanderwaltozyma polyspora DSM 70294]